MATGMKVSVREILFSLSVFTFVYVVEVVQQFLGHQVSRFMGPDVVFLPLHRVKYNVFLTFVYYPFHFSVQSQAINKNAVSQLNSFPVDKICLERQIKIQTRKAFFFSTRFSFFKLHFLSIQSSSLIFVPTFHSVYNLPKISPLQVNF